MTKTSASSFKIMVIFVGLECLVNSSMAYGNWQGNEGSCILTVEIVSVDAESIVRSSSVRFIELMQSQVSPLVFLFTNAFTSIP